MIINGGRSNGATSSDENVAAMTQKSLSFECSSCGHCFESTERLRQHAIDCGDDESASEL
jgi:hypothetical protein